jgi:hypothetical protein
MEPLETQETPDAGNERDPLWRPRSGNGKWRRDLGTVERDQRAAQLASKGWTYSEIAAELGYANRSVAYRAAQRCMYETAVEDGTTEQLRRQQVEELRQLRQRMWAVLDNPPPAISRTGKIVVDDEGNPVPDAAAVVAAAAVVLRANERVSRLRGTEAPKRTVTMTGNASVSEIRAAMATWDPASIRAALEEAAAELAEKDAEAARRPILGAVEE